MHVSAMHNAMDYGCLKELISSLITMLLHQDTYEQVHRSFQSKLSCNITSINGITECGKFLRKKQRGQDNNKREWVIEMNDARALFLASYGVIDNVDKL